ncbi:hypothetical protein ACKWTF_016183 [Chironomus riparius]
MDLNNDVLITCALFFLPTIFQIILLLVLMFKVCCPSNQSNAYANETYGQLTGLNTSPSPNNAVGNVYESPPRQPQTTAFSSPRKFSSSSRQVQIPNVSVDNNNYAVPKMQTENLYNDPVLN